VLDRLERSDRATELHTDLGVLDRHVETHLGATNLLGGKRHGGKRKGDPLTGAVLRVDAEKGRLYIEGVKASKADNKEEAVPVHVSNVVVTQLDESDRFRIAKLTGNRS